MSNKSKLMCLILSLIIIISNCSYAAIYILPGSGAIVGEIQYAKSKIGETIDEVGRRYSMGYYDMVRANPQADATHQLAAGTSLIIPSKFILPDVPHKGIIINLAEYRLYYFPPDDNVLITFPVGIGKEGWNTPTGLTQITAKEANPVWRPTANVLAAAEEMGAPLPEFFPAGPDNPLGKHVLRLAWPTFLIHGTNRFDGVGARVSAGCIRMLPNDIEQLFDIVPVGTMVRVINEPVKIANFDNNIFIQLYPLLKEQRNKKLKQTVEEKLQKWNAGNLIHNKIIQSELSFPSGLIKKISREGIK